MKNRDTLTLMRFIFEEAPVRRKIVHLDETYQEILKRHAYPLQVQEYLGKVIWPLRLIPVHRKNAIKALSL